MIGLVFAAGAGRRMGGPKALLRWGNETLVQAALRAAAASGCSKVFAVVRTDVATALAEVPSDRLIVSHEDDAFGPAGSIAAFARSGRMNGDDGLIAIAPVDVVPSAWDALPALALAVDARPDARAARPVHDGRRGHPVLVRAQVLAEYTTQARPLRDVLRELGPAVIDVSVDVPAVTTDLDTPEDVQRWRPPPAPEPR